MPKKEKLAIWHKKKGSMISSKYLKAQKTENAEHNANKQRSEAQVYADKFTREIKKAFE